MGSDSSLEAEQLVGQADALFDVHDNVSRVIGDLDLPIERFRDEYGVWGNAGSAFDFESMFRLFLYKEVGGFSQQEVAKRVEQWPYLQSRFGLDRPPTQQALSHTKRRRFSRRLRQFIQDVAVGIHEVAQEAGISSAELAIGDTNPDPSEIRESRQPLHHYVDNHAPDVIESLLDSVIPAFDTGRAANAKHDDRTVWEHQTLMSLMDTAGTRAAYRSFNKFRSDALHHDTHTRAVKKLGTPADYQYTFTDYSTTETNRTPVPDWRSIATTIQDQFSGAVEQMLEPIRDGEMFTEPVVAAIDVTNVPYHVSPWKGEEDIEPSDERVWVNGRSKVPKPEYPEMVNGGQEDGVYEFQYATLTVVGRNTPLVLAVEPVRHNSNWEGDDGDTSSWAEVVDRLLEQASELVDIQLVMADRAFDGHGVFHVLDQKHDVNYLIPKKTDSKRLRADAEKVSEDSELKSLVEQDASLYVQDDTAYLDVESDETLGENGYSHDVTFMHVPADRKKWDTSPEREIPYALFVTNRSDDISPMDALGFTNRYSDRWDIEIEYKMITPLVPSIASRDYRMRFFSFVFSCLLYNMWRVTDHSLKMVISEVWDDYGRGKHERRSATLLPLSDYLASSIVLLFSGGFDPPDVTV
ncbi:hypothetical protein [Haloarcula sediminis]|uniref:hypothetical protein n=1 Tax=Haloarcula sediminis TaxID=3111777 RepID=UPI002D7884BA|nr:hypothetical protein [Haloarcula sp. CK38]